MSARGKLAVALCVAALCAPALRGWAQGEPGAPPPDPTWAAADEDPGDFEGMDAGQGPDAPRPGRHEEMRGHRGGRGDMLRDLDLTAEQKQKIADLRDKQERNGIRVRADVQTARLDLRKLMRAEKPDRVAIGRQIDKLAQLQAELHKSQVNTMLDVRGVLTPEQQQKMRERRGWGG